MKARYAILLVMLASAAVLSSPKAMAQIPPPTGHFAVIVQGSVAACVNPTTGAAEACTTAGAVAVPLTITQNGEETRDATGGCFTFTSVASSLPPGLMPPSVSTGYLDVTLVSFDPTTGIGQNSIVNYTGGKCVGATFDTTGATPTGMTATSQIVVSEGGNRIDELITGTNSGAAFSITAVFHKQ